MKNLCRVARSFGLSLLLVGFSGFVFGLSSAASAQGYLPDGPNVPVITLNEGPEGAAGLPPLPVPPPNSWNQQSIWNMKVVGFNRNQGRPSSDDGWIENENGRYILYMTDSGGSAYNPLTGQVEGNGTSLIDVTYPNNPVFLWHIPASQGSSSHVAVCGSNTLNNAPSKPGLPANHWYIVRHNGSIDQEVWDVTNPTAPVELEQILTGLNFTHHIWWECDTGIAYVIAGSAADGWKSGQHVYIFDLSNPAKPVFIRQWGLVGQQPTASPSAQSCYNAPGPTCYEGVTNPAGPGNPEMVHQVYSAGVNINRVYMPYGVSSTGVFQILDRQKLLTGCTVSADPTDCPNNPSQADLLYPQISYTTTNPNQGGHTSIPIFGVPIPQAQENFLDGTPQKYDLLAVTSEDTTNDCLGQPWKNAQLLDITNDLAIWPISSMTVGQFPGDFCAKGARFGTHELNRAIFAPYYGKILVVAMFNAGLQVFDIRDPYNPRRVAYFIQAPNKRTISTCGTYQGNTNYCRNAIFSDLGEVDDRGYIYNLDRAGSGMTVLKLTGDALKVVTGEHIDAPKIPPVRMPEPLKEE